MTTRKRDEKETEDWFEVMGLSWDATAEDVSKGEWPLLVRTSRSRNPAPCDEDPHVFTIHPYPNPTCPDHPS